MTERAFGVGDVVYQRPETKRAGLPRQIDLGDGAWVVTEILDGGLVRLRLESGTTMATAKADVLATAEEMVADELMGQKWPCDYVGCWPRFSIGGLHCSSIKGSFMDVTCRRGHAHRICSQAYDLLDLGETGREMPCFSEDFCLSCLRSDTDLYECKDCDACLCNHASASDCPESVYVGQCDHRMRPMKRPRRTL